jgi:uncharacterized protein
MASPRSQLRVGVTELLRHPGSRLDVQRVVPAADLGELVVGASRVEPDSDVAVDLVLDSQPDTIVASGTVSALWTGECRRCLEPVVGELQQDVREVFGEVPEGEEDTGDFYPLDLDQVNLEPLVRDAVLLSLPVAPLCGPDCKGPVPDAFVDGDDEDADEAAAAVPDPRWAALDALDFDQ